MQFMHYGVCQPAMQSLDMIGQHNCTAVMMLHSCGELVMWLYQSWDLIGVWNSSLHAQGFSPSSPDPFPSLRVGFGDETNGAKHSDHQTNTNWELFHQI